MSDYQTYTPPNEPEQPFQPETPVDPAPSFVDPGITSDDKLWAMLSYILTPHRPCNFTAAGRKEKETLYPCARAAGFGIRYSLWDTRSSSRATLPDWLSRWTCGICFSHHLGNQSQQGRVHYHPLPDRFHQATGLGLVFADSNKAASAALF